MLFGDSSDCAEQRRSHSLGRLRRRDSLAVGSSRGRKRRSQNMRGGTWHVSWTCRLRKHTLQNMIHLHHNMIQLILCLNINWRGRKHPHKDIHDYNIQYFHWSLKVDSSWDYFLVFPWPRHTDLQATVLFLLLPDFPRLPFCYFPVLTVNACWRLFNRFCYV